MESEEMTEREGIFTISAEEYHKDPCPAPSLSSSIAKMMIHDSPAHARLHHPRLVEQPIIENGTHFDIGSVAHAILLEDKLEAEIIDAPDWRTNAAKEARDLARSRGRIPLLKKHSAAVGAMLVALKEQLKDHRAKNMFTDGRGERTLIWREEDHIWCRARLDWLHDSYKYIDDYKTTSATANPEVISRTMFANGWDIQAAFYLRGLKKLTGKDAEFRFCVQETFPPYALSVIGLNPDTLLIGHKKVEYAMETWARCLAEDNWPGYPRDICYAMLPPWEEARWIEREMKGIR